MRSCGRLPISSKKGHLRGVARSLRAVEPANFEYLGNGLCRIGGTFKGSCSLHTTRNEDNSDVADLFAYRLWTCVACGVYWYRSVAGGSAVVCTPADSTAIEDGYSTVPGSYRNQATHQDQRLRSVGADQRQGAPPSGRSACSRRLHRSRNRAFC